MLADVLPGFRELRGPLAAGYLWLVFAWLLFGDEVEGSGGVVGRLVDLEHGLSQVAVAAAASFVAYLIGSVSEDIFGRGLRHVVDRSSKFIVGEASWRGWGQRRLSTVRVGFGGLRLTRFGDH